MSAHKGVWKNFLVVLILVAAIGASIFLVVDQRSEVRCAKLIVRVEDSSQMKFVTSDMVRKMLDTNSIQVVGQLLNRLDLHKIQTTILNNPYVKSACVNSTMRGDVMISLTQFKPQIRIITENGYDFYADTLGNIIPVALNYNYDTPLVSGYGYFGFNQSFFGELNQKNRSNDIEYLKNLINFVEFIEQDKFLNLLVSQIYLMPNRNIELITWRTGQIIDFGPIDNWSEKLNKTRDFFAQSPLDVATGAPCRIVVKYKDQILVKLTPQLGRKAIEDGE